MTRGRARASGDPLPVPPQARGRWRARGAWIVLALLPVALTAAVYVTRERAGARTAPAHGDAAELEPAVRELLDRARAATAADPRSAQAWGRLGAVLDAHGMQAEAVRAYRRAKELDPGGFRWVYNLAHVSGLLGEDIATVRALYADAAHLAPSYAPLGCQLGSLLARAGDQAGASEAFRRTLALDPDFALARRGLGYALLARGDARGAIGELERAAELLPDDAVTQSALAQAYRETGDRERADRAAERSRSGERVLEIPDAVRQEVAALAVGSTTRFARAMDLLALGRAAEACDELAPLGRDHPKDARIQKSLGLALAAAGRLPDARSAFEGSLKIDARQADAELGLGRVLDRSGDRPGAREHWLRALAIDPGNGEAHAALAKLSLRLGQVDDALRSFAEAGARRALSAEGLTDWAVALVQRGENDLALERCREALALDPAYARGHYGIGFVLQKQDRLEEAARSYAEAVRLDPSYADARANLGVCHEALGRVDDAILEYRIALALDPRVRVAERRAALEAARSGAPLSPEPEFQAAAERLHASDQAFLGRAPARELERERRDPRRTSADRVGIDARLARERLEQGDLDGARDAIDAARSALASVPGSKPSPELHRLRGAIGLWRAGVPDLDPGVLDPDTGAAILDPERRAAAEDAFAGYRDYLAARPDDLGARWLLGVVARALGDPERVPPELALELAGAPASAAPLGRFGDAAPRLGLAHPRSGGGVVLADVDGDGLRDVVTASFDPSEPLSFQRNAGERFVDRSEASHLAEQLGGPGLVATDFDGDEDVDLLVLRGARLGELGRIRNSLLANDGAGVFTDVTWEMGLALPALPTRAAAWGDLDGDGDQDLVLANEDVPDGPALQLFANGLKRFEDVAARAGLAGVRACTGLAVGDVDNDGDLDLYVAGAERSHLFQNGGGLSFADVGEAAGVAAPRGSSATCWFFDYDDDGWLDLFSATDDHGLAEAVAARSGKPVRSSTVRLFQNQGGTFTDVTREAGLETAAPILGGTFGDLDGDGRLDVVLTTGDPDLESLLPELVLWNEGGRRFLDVAPAAGLDGLQRAAGVAIADLDLDLEPDVYLRRGGFHPVDRGPDALLRNPLARGHVLALRLRAEPGRTAEGARLRVVVGSPQGTREIHRVVGAGGAVDVGLGSATGVASLEVRWPSGARTEAIDVPLDAAVRIAEASPGFDALPLERGR